jgi:MFS family permease
MATITPDRTQPQEPHGFELPSKHLPAVETRDLPEPVPFRKVVGASVIILATAIGSGEFVLWPYITSQVGLVFIWAAVVGFLIQFFINMEVERYTLATGETALTGFSRLWKPWGVLFIVMALCQNFWPGWATGAATTLTFAFGGGDVVTITVLALIAIGLALTASPVVYQTTEKAMGAMVVAIMAFVVIAVVLATDAGAWGDFATSFTSPEVPVDSDKGLTIALLLGALAFAGAGGANNLVQSNYIRDKNMGMGQRIPHIVSPITGEEEADAPFGYTFTVNDENMRRWRGWWSVANKEQFITFFLVGLASLIVLSVLTYSTVPVGSSLGESFDFIEAEGNTLKDQIAPWFGTAFWICGAIALFSTNLGILDYTSRLIADQTKVSAARTSTFWSESKIYFASVWTMIIFGCIVLLSGLEQPLLLLVISSSIAGVMMFIYSILLIQLNRRALPGEIKIRGTRLGVMAISVLFFGVFSVLLVIDQGKQLF